MSCHHVNSKIDVIPKMLHHFVDEEGAEAAAEEMDSAVAGFNKTELFI